MTDILTEVKEAFDALDASMGLSSALANAARELAEKKSVVVYGLTLAEVNLIAAKGLPDVGANQIAVAQDKTDPNGTLLFVLPFPVGV